MIVGKEFRKTVALLVRGLIKELDLALAKEVRVWGVLADWVASSSISSGLLIIDRVERQKERNGC